MFPEVHGENGAGAIKDGSQGGHESCYHHRHHQAPESWKEKYRCLEECPVTPLQDILKFFFELEQTLKNGFSPDFKMAVIGKY